jgi:hypothetical protein
MAEVQKNENKDLNVPINFISFQSINDSPYIFDGAHHAI